MTKIILKFVEIIDASTVPENSFIFLDNGSDNNYMDEFFSSIENPSNKWRVVRSTNNLGYGGGIVFASGFVEKDFVAWMPGNMKVDPIEAFNFINNINLNSHTIYIKAKRVGRPLIDSLKTKLFGIISSIYFNTYIYDVAELQILFIRVF